MSKFSLADNTIYGLAVISLAMLASLGLCIWGLTALRRVIRLHFMYHGDADLMARVDMQRAVDRMMSDATIHRS